MESKIVLEIFQRLTAVEVKMAGLLWANLGVIAIAGGIFIKKGVGIVMNGNGKKNEK